MKLGKWEFKWTRNRTITAMVAAGVLLLGLGVWIGQRSEPPQEAVEEVPPYPVNGDDNLPADVKKQVDILARGAMLSIFFHETGHMLISELDLPAIGPEEDAVDEFATFFLTDALKDAPKNQKDIYATIVFSGALFWKISATQSNLKNFPFYDEHSPDVRRYYNILCIATGADPLRFIPMAVEDGVPESRLAKCAEEYKKKHAAWETLIAPHLHGMLGRLLHTGGRMTLKAGPVEKSEWLPFELTFRQGGFFQNVLDGLSDNYDLPDDIAVIPKGCNGTVNAWWSADSKSVTLCYDMFANVEQIFANAAEAQLQHQQQAEQAPQQTPAPEPQAPQPTPQPMPPPGGGNQGTNAAMLTGQWLCQSMDRTTGLTEQEQTSLTPDGEFTSQLIWSNGVRMNVWGRWSAPMTNTLRYDVAGTNPPGGMPTPIIVPFQMPNPETLQTQNATCRKVG